MQGTLEGMFVICAPKGPPIALREARFRPGGGVPTDQRDRPGTPRPVSAICAETLDAVGAALGIAIAPGASARMTGRGGVILDVRVGGLVRLGDAVSHEGTWAAR